jgi:site-specific recombinase
MSKGRNKAAVVNPSPESIIIKSNSMYYRAVATAVKEGSRVFVPEMGRRTASYARKRLSELVGNEVLGYPVQVSGQDGYLFHLRKVKS